MFKVLINFQTIKVLINFFRLLKFYLCLFRLFCETFLATIKSGNLDPTPRLILATVTLTTIDVDGIAVIVKIFTEVAGVDVMKNVDVSVGGVKKVVVVWEIMSVIVVTEAEFILPNPISPSSIKK